MQKKDFFKIMLMLFLTLFWLLWDFPSADNKSCGLDYVYISQMYANMKITKIDSSTAEIKFYGIDLNTHEPYVFDSNTKWFVFVKGHVAVGDTFLKDIGSNRFFIKSRLGKTEFFFECEADSALPEIPIFNKY
ncbi:hypothetical protein [Hymenobacter metallilatus]|uniref:Uncharacterized protein n=1 Tax=Hymenobacter metallilatus TaxID=2493666 RepID=A0A428JCU1_9BACT|nr:hypothetical protein [Hymenobacter metallilatus]RSK29914.1 hypothetical protein EI290_16395 [Hymenobacter metallilatus]